MMRLARLIVGVLALVTATAAAQSSRTSSQGSIRDVATTPHAQITRAALTPAETQATIDFEVVLKMRSLGELQARVGRHETINRTEMVGKYHPLAGDYASVIAWLKGAGLTIMSEDSSHLAVFGRGTVDQVSRAFQATFARVSFAGRETSSAVTAPSFPASLSGVVLGINGLQPHLLPQKHIIPAAMQPLSTTGNGPPFLPSQIAKAYNGSSVTQTGTGQTIAIVIDTFPSNSDLTSFWTTCGVSQSLSNIQEIQVVPGTLPAPSGEETLDVEWSSSMAPAAKVRVYATTDLAYTHLDQAYAQVYADLASQPTLHQMSLSYGLGEIYSSTVQMQTDEQFFAVLASAGVTIFVSTGDGASNPTSTGASGGSTPTPESPSTSLSVTAVGGTALTVDSTSGLETSETVWDSTFNGVLHGTGGGISTYFSRPSWQTGTGVPSGTTRTVPDIAAPADPSTGALVVLNGANQTFGGTSWSAPTWAGICALINQARAGNSIPPLGLLGPHIYPLIGTASFRDITSGSNGAYNAGTGYDLCTGIGVPSIATLLQSLSSAQFLNTAPYVTSPPATQSVAAGQNASFSVTVVGNTPFTYQWQREAAGFSKWANLTDNATYSGSTAATLTVASATAVMSGDQFQCVVTNTYGSATTPSAPLYVNVNTAPLIISTLAGVAGTTGSSDGAGSAALLNYPGGIAFDKNGNIVIADSNSNTIRKVTPAGAVSTYAGAAGVAGSTDSNTSPLNARFNGPSNVAVDTTTGSTSGTIYVADAGNETIRKITTAGVVTRLTGLTGSAGSADGNSSVATFNAPAGVAVDSSGNVFVADAFNNTIRKVTTSGTVSTFAGTAGTTGSADATGANARFNFPVNVAFDPAGNLFVADTNNHIIRKITTAGVVTTFAGSAGLSGNSDGVGANALFTLPTGVRTDSAGNVYVTGSNQTVRKITPTGAVTTLAGAAGITGSSDGVGSAARFYNASDALPDASGNIYVIDTYNQTLRKGISSTAPAIQTSPASQTVAPGQNATFTVAATGKPTPTYQWQRLPAGGSTWASLSNSGAYSGTTTTTLTVTSATIGMSGDQFQCLATNAAGSTTSAVALLTVGIAPQITSANGTTFLAGLFNSFTVTATGTPAPTFSATGLPSWASLDPNTGALTGTPPGVAGAPFAFSITARNGVAPSAVQNFTLGVRMTFAGWQNLHFGANVNNASIAGPNADPNNNGIANLLEYALGGDPLAVPSSVALPAVVPALESNDGQLHLTLTVMLDATASDLTVTGEVSADFQTWNTGAGYVEIISDSTVGTIRTLSLRDSTPLGATAQHYLRLRVTKP